MREMIFGLLLFSLFFSTAHANEFVVIKIEPGLSNSLFDKISQEALDKVWANRTADVTITSTAKGQQKVVEDRGSYSGVKKLICEGRAGNAACYLTLPKRNGSFSNNGGRFLYDAMPGKQHHNVKSDVYYKMDGGLICRLYGGGGYTVTTNCDNKFNQGESVW